MLLALRTTPATEATSLDKIAHQTIKTRLCTRYPHGGIAINGVLYHATARKGVHVVTDWNPERWVLFDLGGDDIAALERYEQRKGNRYNWVGLLPFIGVPGSDRERDYCFQLAYFMVTGIYPRGLVTAETLLALRPEMHPQKGK
jgi:hypothetical protein